MQELILNSFPAEIDPQALKLPYVEFSSWEHSALARNADYSEYKIYRYKHPVFQDPSEPVMIRMVLLSGPKLTSKTKLGTHDIAELPHLANTLIESSLGHHLASRGMTIYEGKFVTRARRRVRTVSSGLIHLYSGISFRCRRPNSRERYRFALSVQWESGAEFSETLSNPQLREIATGLPVLYTPENGAQTELSYFETKFIGQVDSFRSHEQAMVNCKDGVRRLISVKDLTLEARSEAIRRFELRFGDHFNRRTIFHEIQHLSKVLKRNNRRNLSVLPDRLSAIVSILEGSSKRELTMRLRSYQKGLVRIGLSPQRVTFTP